MFAENLKNWRQEKGLTQADLAKALYVSQQAVSLWETGKSYPDVPTLRSLAALLGVKVDDLIAEQEYDQAQSEKKVHVPHLLPLSMLGFGIVISLLGLSALFCYLSFGYTFFFLGILLLILWESIVIVGASFAYRKAERNLVVLALVAFFSSGLLCCALAALDFGWGSGGTASSWLLLSAGIFSGLAGLVFLILLLRREGKSAPSSVTGTSGTAKRFSLNLKEPLAYVGVGAALLLLVLLFCPWRESGTCVPDSAGNRVCSSHFYSPWFLLRNSGVFYGFDFVELILDLGLFVLGLLLFLYPLNPKTKTGVKIAIIVTLIASVGLFLGLLPLAFRSAPLA
jgi:transcriptional regulator with XRE-family HTH domain